MQRLNVPAMTKAFLDNYNAHVDNFIRFLKNKLDCYLVYDGPLDIHTHVVERTTYTCSVRCNNPIKTIRDVFPVMISSRLDTAIRNKVTSFRDGPVPTFDEPIQFTPMDIGRGFFIINGFLRQVPCFYTNDPTNTHLISNHSVRVYTYDANDKGKELSYYTRDTKKKKRGDIVVILNDGSESEVDLETFFEHCPYPIDALAYMTQMYREDSFDIDDLSNKIIVTPGHLFFKLFVKYLYTPLRERLWVVVKQKNVLVTKSIETGTLQHVLSRKTPFVAETKSMGKMTNLPHESHREIGANGEIFVEKSSNCYRDINSQTYPLNPYYTQMIVRQMSSKVKPDSVKPIHRSSVGYFCILGCFETKNVGRTTMMVRDTIVSVCDELDPVFSEARRSRVWTILNLEPMRSSFYHVVVNEACVPVSKKCFDGIDLLELKRQLVHVECLRRDKFIYIRYKTGLMFKLLPDAGVWITVRDQLYWAKHFFGIDTQNQLHDRFGYEFITSHIVDLNNLFKNTSFTKTIASFNSLKNAVLAVKKDYAWYFMDSVSAYQYRATRYHRTILEPEDDGISPHFVFKMPRVMVAYQSFKGITQEDCIVRRSDVDAFDCCRFYTLRLKLESDGLVVFHPVWNDDDTNFVGTIVHHGQNEIEIEPFSMHIQIVKVSKNVYQMYYTKSPFRVVQYYSTPKLLSVCLEQDHLSDTGDKLSSFHGQKGIMRSEDQVPLLDEKYRPDLIVNPYCMFRMTAGQIREGLNSDEIWDAKIVRNSDGEIVPDSSVLYQMAYYFPIAYWSSEHWYAPSKCVQDKILSQAVKGRSRGGGMRLGNMELFNGLRGNGLASCFEEKFFEHGDRVPTESDPTIALPKATSLVIEDAKFFKFNIEYKSDSSVVPIKKF